MFLMDFDGVLVFATINTIIFEMIPARSDPATWYTLYKMSFPFDVHSVRGYFGYLIMMIVAIHTYGIILTSQVGFFLGSCFYLDAFIEDFHQMMYQLNDFTSEDEQFVDHVQTRIADAVRFNIQIIEYVIKSVAQMVRTF